MSAQGTEEKMNYDRWHRVKDWLVQIATVLLFCIIVMVVAITAPLRPVWEYFSHGRHFYLKMAISGAFWLLFFVCRHFTRKEGDKWEWWAGFFMVFAIIVMTLGVVGDEPLEYDA
jgi:hypothetical protein